MLKKAYFILLMTISFTIFCDNKSVDDPFEARKNQFKKTMDEKIKTYDEERARRDNEFNQRLKDSWEEFKTRKETFGLGPKPETLPEAKEVELIKTDEPEVEILPITPKELVAEPKPAEPKEYKFEDKTKNTSFNFYGDKLKISYPKALSDIRTTLANDKTISEAWEKTSRTEYSPLLTQLENFSDSYGLNPWGVYKLANTLSEKIYKNRTNRIIFTAFILTQMEMNCKVAHSNNKAYLLLPSEKPLYSKPYLTIDNTKFYIITPVTEKLTKINTYTAEFPGVPDNFDLTIYKLPKLREIEANKRLSFNYNGVNHGINVTYNRALVEFFEDYPQTHYENYFETDLHPRSREAIIKALEPIIKGKSESEAVNIILHFVQKSFEYQTDQEQFNREKPLFPEETLHYKYSDCEDRSVLFTYLVKEMLGLEVVGLKYPGHMSTAVLLKEPGEDSVKIGNKNYTIADPTFINANIGMAMPSYKNSTPEVIGIK